MTNIQLLNKEKNITFLICSHQLDLIQKICTSIGIMSKGKLIGEGKIDNLGRGLFSGGKYKIEVELSNTTPKIIEIIRNIDKVISIEEKDGVFWR